MNEQQTRSNQQNQKRTGNGWKWAFFILLALVLGFFAYLAINLQPVSVNEQNDTPTMTTDDTIVLSASMNTEDTEQLINTYLEAEMTEDFEGYTVALTNQLEIHGDITILGFAVPFSLYLDPYVTENGNIQLRGESVELANFSLPVSGVMSLLANQMDFPDFVAIDSGRQIIGINLDELTTEYNFDIEMTQINLEEGMLGLNLRVDEGTITNQLQTNE
jgi:uncharacterized protein YpmS